MGQRITVHHVHDGPSWADLRAELAVPESFPAAVLAEADDAVHRPFPPLPDLTAVPFLTIDPPGSLDLDQAMHLERTSDGYRVRYAIADVASFVTPGGQIDAEAHRRGATAYFPDVRVPLHPPVLAEDAASLLPEQVRPAVVWDLGLSADGELRTTAVSRALVRSVRRLTYAEVQQAMVAGAPDEQLLLLAEIGPRRQALARARGAVDIPTPEQEVTDGPDGLPRLSFRAQLPSEGWNAQISLLTGIAAAGLMLGAKIGLLRTLPPPQESDVVSLRRSALALGLEWPPEASYGDVVSTLDPTQPGAAALLTLATRLLRGAGYVAFDGSLPEQPLHSAVAASYAHCTAPLRRLADRYVNEVCLAVSAGASVPPWARAALPALPEEMSASDRRAHELDRAVVDLAEALVLGPRVGEIFDAVVVDSGTSSGTVQLREPAVRARCEGADLPLGEQVRVRLVTADALARKVVFALAD
ncbi:MAG: RNB domain-containing ribonuclease [Mycobacteriales bacterium]